MKLKEVMTANVASIPATQSVRDAAKLMEKEDIGMLPVMQDGRSLAGVVTDRDIVTRAVAPGLDLAKTQVSDVMTRSLQVCTEDQSVEEVAELMQAHRLRRIVVLDGRKHPIGVVSLGDLARKSKEAPLVHKTLEHVSTPA